MCCISGVGFVCRKSVELNFVKTGLKCKFGVNPQSFSHELCLYITRFPARRAGSGDETTSCMSNEHAEYL